MSMKVEKAFPGARGVDSYPFSVGGTAAQAAALATSGIEFFVGYLGPMTPERLAMILDNGLAFMPVTFAAEYKDGAADEIAQLTALGIPKGCTVWLDMEGIDAWNMDIVKLTALIEAWASAIVAAGYIAGLYVGAPQPFTGKQLYALKNITRYWLGQGRCVSKPTTTEQSRDAYPNCGWCMRQDWHNNPNAAQGVKGGMLWKKTGVLVDTNAIQADHQGRLPTWVVRA